MSTRQSVSVLISSCDAFADCWPPYFHGLRKYWPDCPYPVFVITNFLTSVDEFANAIPVGLDQGWTANTRKALEQLDTRFVLYTHEDFWLKAPVETAAIHEYVRLMDIDAADYIRLYPCPEPTAPFESDDRLGTLERHDPYRASLQVALWRVSVLKELLVDGENPWEFEIRGSMRSRRFGGRFLSVRRLSSEGDRAARHYGVDYVCTAINKGRWSKDARRYAALERLEIDFSNRPLERWYHRSRLFGRTEHLLKRVRRALRPPIGARP